jgi:glucose/arabinose dehydrogenase
MRRAVLSAALLVGISVPALAADVPIGNIKLPPGFSVELYARVSGARQITVVPELKAVFVGSNHKMISAIVDDNGDGKPERTVKVIEGLTNANGAVWSKGKLYVSDQTRVMRYDAPNVDAISKDKGEVAYTGGLPASSHHGQRYTTVGPDGMLYVSVGSPCNICKNNGIEGTILGIDPVTGKGAVFARGIRNTVGIDFHPRTRELYFTDNGSDGMGDDSPPDELNHAPRAGMNFGFPWFGGGEDRTPNYKNEQPPADVTPPIVKFGAHVAALGLHFVRGTMLPEDYRRDAFVAQHGSWNRSTPDGYRVARVKFDASGKAQGWEPFMEGFISGREAWGRPVDVKELPDGSLLVSDDKAGAVYRVTYKK